MQTAALTLIVLLALISSVRPQYEKQVQRKEVQSISSFDTSFRGTPVAVSQPPLTETPEDAQPQKAQVNYVQSPIGYRPTYTGNSNSNSNFGGAFQSGNSNTYTNVGAYQSGNSKTNSNAGAYQSGNSNSNTNAGAYQSGNSKTNSNAGAYQSGFSNSKVGAYRSGNSNSNYQSGNSNSNSNAGAYQSGNSKTVGTYRSGNSNSNTNAGAYQSGNSKTVGTYRSGNSNINTRVAGGYQTSNQIAGASRSGGIYATSFKSAGSSSVYGQGILGNNRIVYASADESGNFQSTSDTQPGIPSWAIAVIVVGSVLLVALTVVIVQLMMLIRSS